MNTAENNNYAFPELIEEDAFTSYQSKFICGWGRLCTNWGVNKTMGQIHAVLLVSNNLMCADEIMERLSMSRGNVNMNLRALENWRLIEKKHIAGERKDFYQAEKDLSKVFKIIVAERKKKELDPLMELLEEMETVRPKCQQSNEFCKVTAELHKFAKRADFALSSITSDKASWISKILIR